MENNVITVFEAATVGDLEMVRQRIQSHKDSLKLLEPLEKLLANRFPAPPVEDDDLDLELTFPITQPTLPGAKVASNPVKRPELRGGTNSPPVKSTPAIPAPGLKEKRQKIARWLNINGPSTQEQIFEGTKINKYGPNCISMCLGCDWFHKNPDGLYSVTTKADLGSGREN